MPGRKHVIGLVLLSSLLLFSFTASAQEADSLLPSLKAVRVNGEGISIDGNLKDAVWTQPNLPKARSFRQMDPDEGKAETESTLVAVAYDDGALYIAFWNFDTTPQEVARLLVRRDRSALSDLVSVRLDPYHDHQTGYRFDVNAAGVQWDGRYYDDVNLDNTWDGVWESAVQLQSWGWSAEMRIPFYCLRFAPADSQTWGLNLARYIPRKNETNWWAFSPSTEGGNVSRFGHLTGLMGIKPDTHVEVLPYAVTSLKTDPPTSGNSDGRDLYKNTGVDLKYSLSSNLILDATINPDFGQVELDQPVLNLSTYETWYDEKRPFFLEGANLFATRFTLFYSRRIGRPPRGLKDGSQVDYFVHYPEATSILGAGKLTGKLHGGTAVGFMSVMTAEEKADYVDLSGISKDGVVEPLGNYSVIRLKQDILSNSYIGGIATLVGHEGHHPAQTGGADWRLYTADGVWGTSGQMIFSRVDEGKPGFGFAGDISKDAGKHICGSLGWTIKDPHLQINHLGYTPRNDMRHVALWVQYRTQDDWWIIRNSWNNINLYGSWNYAGIDFEKGGNFNFWIELLNNWEFGGGIGADLYKYDDLETRGGPLWERFEHPTWDWWASLNSDLRRSFSININPGSGRNRGGTWWANYVGLCYRPQSNIEVEVGSNFMNYANQTRWVENRGDSTIFASLDYDELTPSFSASVLFHRNLSLQFSAEAVIAGLDYSNARLYHGGQEYEPIGSLATDEKGETFSDRYDYNYSAINSTFIIRWEYLPGSTLYLVWTRSRDEVDADVNRLNFERDIDRLFSRGGHHVFLIKASYWWNI